MSGMKRKQDKAMERYVLARARLAEIMLTQAKAEAAWVASGNLSFGDLRTANAVRCFRGFGHEIDAWSPGDWATAMAGECGEACNEVKKLRRLGPLPEVVKANGNAAAVHDATEKIASELADLIIYADLLAARLGIELGPAVRRKFNEVSDRVKCDVKL